MGGGVWGGEMGLRTHPCTHWNMPVRATGVCVRVRECALADGPAAAPCAASTLAAPWCRRHPSSSLFSARPLPLLATQHLPTLQQFYHSRARRQEKEWARAKHESMFSQILAKLAPKPQVRGTMVRVCSHHCVLSG